jgi:hypothetical protein
LRYILFNLFAYDTAWYMPKLDFVFLQIVAMSCAVSLLQVSMQDNTARGSDETLPTSWQFVNRMLPILTGKLMLPATPPLWV